MPDETRENDAPDDHLDRELRSLLEGDASQAAFREPSAREREKLARQARKAEKRAAKGRRTSPARRRRYRQSLWGLGVVIVLAAAVIGYVRFEYSPGNGPGGTNDTQVVRNGAVPPTAQAVSPLTESRAPSDPFQGTPADKWPDGAAGIVIPAAKPVGRYSATQVESAYQTTKKMLVAAALNKPTLNGGAPTAFADLLTPPQRTKFLSQLDKIGLDKNGTALSSRGWIVQFAPGTAKFIGSVIKVTGTMSAHPSTDSDGQAVLAVDINYRIAYAVEPPRAPADWMRIVAQFQHDILFGNWADANTSFGPWWISSPGIAGARCGTRDGFVHPDYPTGPPQSVQPSGRAIDPYSLREDPSDNACQATTGT